MSDVLDDVQGAFDDVFNDITGAGLLAAVLIALLAWPVVLFVGWAVRTVLGLVPGVSDGIVRLVQRVLQALVAVVAIALCLAALDLGPGVITFVVIVIGVVVGVSAQSLLQNAAASMAMPYFVGDEIDSHDYTGKVWDITYRHTVIETRDHRKVYIPNVDVMAQPIVMYTAFDQRRSEIEVGVRYSTSVGDVITLLVDTIGRVEGVHTEPAPYARVSGFGDGMYRLLLRWWHDPDIATTNRVKGEVYAAVKTALDDAGIPIPPPIGVFLSELP